MPNPKNREHMDPDEAAPAPPPSPPHPLSSLADGAGEMPLLPRPVPADGRVQDLGSESDGAATPRPAAAAPAPSGRDPALTHSPTTSEVDQAGFYPVPLDRTRKHPGTPSDRFAESERRDARSAAMQEKERDARKTVRNELRAAGRDPGQIQPMTATRRSSNVTGGSILPQLNLPPFNPNLHGGIPRTNHEAPSAPVTAKRASKPADLHANPAELPDPEISAPRPASPHFSRISRTSSGSFALSRFNASNRNHHLQQSLPHHASFRRGPSPSRAESSASGAARSQTLPPFQDASFPLKRIVKKEPASPFTIPPAQNNYYDSEDDDLYLSPSEERVLRELQRKRSAARAAQRQREFEAHGITEVPAPAMPQTARSDAMSITDSSSSDSDDMPALNLANGGVAINNPQPSEDQLAATVALHPALADSRINVTAAGVRGPVDGLTRNHYWLNACPEQRHAIFRARGYKVLARAIGIIGHPEVNPRDPAMLAFLNKTLRDMFGDNSRALATRINAAVGARRGESTAPDAFAITGLTAAQADFLNSPLWLLAGALQLEIHAIEEPASNHIYTAVGAMVSRNRFRREMLAMWTKDPEIKAIVAAHAAQKNMTFEEVMALLIASLRLEPANVVLPRSPGVVTRQFTVNGGDFLSTELHRRLREAASNIVVDTRLRGRAEAWTGWHCIVCNSITHPTGMCPSRILAGWAAAADEILRRLKEKNKRDEQNNNKKPPRFDDNKRDGQGGGNGGRAAGQNGARNRKPGP